MILSFGAARARARSVIMGDAHDAFRAAAVKSCRRAGLGRFAGAAPCHIMGASSPVEGPRHDETAPWPDWRAFPIAEIVERDGFGPSRRGVSTARYKVRIRDRVANLFPERKACDLALS